MTKKIIKKVICSIMIFCIFFNTFSQVAFATLEDKPIEKNSVIEELKTDEEDEKLEQELNNIEISEETETNEEEDSELQVEESIEEVVLR